MVFTNISYCVMKISKFSCMVLCWKKRTVYLVMVNIVLKEKKSVFLMITSVEKREQCIN
jgi:hypothetical protein